MRAMCPDHLFFLKFTIQMILGDEYELRKFCPVIIDSSKYLDPSRGDTVILNSVL